ncbi:MerR family transcriptional regulator [Actinomadura atramentaria]|uniref:MerR family transcriptional regulator n=1 Tax=Actinomadura atramentaria TaxID=1990 RepID=UPI00035F23FC|nr:MerR family transcriptional regulator [Actinomadura atramentaria]
MARTHMQIGEVAERTGLSLRTIRYYGEVGLAPPTARSQGGFRLYTEDDVARLHVIMRMKPLGFSLEEMRELLEVLDGLAAEETAAPDRGARLGKLAAYHGLVEERTAELRARLADAEGFAGALADALGRHRA